MSESELLAVIDEYLTRTGWMVRKFSQDCKTRRQLAGWVDRVAIRDDVTLYIEAKAKNGRRWAKQIIFAAEIGRHLGPHLRYVLARSLEDVIDVSG